MRIFVDANILVSVLNKEYPLFTYSSRLLSLHDRRNFKIYTSPVCLAIAWYFAEKKSNAKIARGKMRVLCEHISIAPANKETVQAALANKKVNDFEDGLEYYSALSAKCHFIITEDRDDFYFSEIPVVTARDFFEQRLVKGK
jgi:predicted nucleic acid-binding protein